MPTWTAYIDPQNHLNVGSPMAYMVRLGYNNMSPITVPQRVAIHRKRFTQRSTPFVSTFPWVFRGVGHSATRLYKGLLFAFMRRRCSKKIPIHNGSTDPLRR